MCTFLCLMMDVLEEREEQVSLSRVMEDGGGGGDHVLL